VDTELFSASPRPLTFDGTDAISPLREEVDMKLRILVACLVVTGLCWSGCKKKEMAPEEKKSEEQAAAAPTEERKAPSAVVVARVGDSPITKEEIDKESARIRGNLELTIEQQDSVRRRALEQLIERRLVLEAAREEKMLVSEEQIKAHVDSVKASKGGEEAFAAWLARTGVTADEYKEEARYEILLDRLVDKYYPVATTEEDLRAYHAKRAASPAKGEKARVHRIVIKVPEGSPEQDWASAEAKVASILKEIEAGLPFADAAKKYSQDGYAKRGGNMGIGGANRRPEEIFGPALAMKDGEMKGPTRVSDGVQLILVTERYSDKVGSFEEEEEKLRGAFEKRTRALHSRKLLRELAERFHVAQ